MPPADAEFDRIIVAIVTRLAEQTGRPAPDAAIAREFSGRLHAMIKERGLPRPLQAGECGMPGSMSETECAPLVERVLGGVTEPVLAEAARQLIKACFYPEFTVCRDSFREVARDGSCRRQELSRVLTRVSGTHCVDCPHWVALTPERHAEFLAGHWVGDEGEFDAHRAVFLPEDFRILRRWLHAAARVSREG